MNDESFVEKEIDKAIKYQDIERKERKRLNRIKRKQDQLHPTPEMIERDELIRDKLGL